MKLIFSLLLLLVAPAAHAACDYLDDGIENKMQEYRAYRNRNKELRDQLRGKEQECRDRGSTVSAKAARLAEARSCEAMGEAGGLDGDIAGLGQDCADVFGRIRDLEDDLRNKFRDVHKDLDNALAFMNGSELLQNNCALQLKTANKMGEAFIALEGSMLGNRDHANKGNGDYNKMRDSGRALAAANAGLRAGCGSATDPSDSRLVSDSHGQGSGQISADRPSRGSDLTGVEKAEREEAVSAGAIQNH